MYLLAIIGCGRISYKHIQAAIENNEILCLAAVCDIDQSRAEGRAAEYAEAGYPKPEVYSDYKQMVSNSNIDIVAIATESGYHAEIAIYCMKQGKNVLIEKPMALSVTDADVMIQAAKENNVKLCIAHQNRFNPPVQKLRQALEAGRFGKIIAGNARVLWNRNAAYYAQAPWRGTYQLDGGCLMNQCIHNIDLLQWMLGGDVQWIHGTVGNYIHDYIEAEDYGSIQIQFAGKRIGNVEGTVCVYPSNLEETLTIIGEKGTVSIGGLAVNKIETWAFSDGLDDEETVKKECNGDVANVYGNGHTPLYKDLIDAIENDRKPYISGEDGKISMEIILGAYKSSKEERRIAWNECTDLKSEGGGIK